MDIEELHRLGEQHNLCPYYASKDRILGADIIFMPYNYIIDEKIRENFKLDFTNSIIIFDEGHNVTQVAEDVTSFELPTKLLESSVSEVQQLLREKQTREDGDSESGAFKASEDDMENIMIMLRSLKQHLDNYYLDQESVPNFRIDKQFLQKESMVMPGQMIFKILEEGTKCKFKLLIILQSSIQRERHRDNMILTFLRIGIDGELPLNRCQLILKSVCNMSLNHIVSRGSDLKTAIEQVYEVFKKVIRVEGKLKSKMPQTSFDLVG